MGLIEDIKLINLERKAINIMSSSATPATKVQQLEAVGLAAVGILVPQLEPEAQAAVAMAEEIQGLIMSLIAAIHKHPTVIAATPAPVAS